MKMSVDVRAWLAFAVVLLVAAAAAAWALLTPFGYARYELRTREAVSGLIAGAPVEFHGVEVGRVREVRLLDPRSVRVVLDVRQDAPVTTATVATIIGRGMATRGFTGYVYVNLEDTGAAGQPLAAAGGQLPQIAVAPGQSTNLDTTISQMGRDVQAVAGLLQGALDRETVASLKQTVASLEQVTRTLAANNARLGTTLANAERASTQLQPLLQSHGAAVQTLRTQVLPQAQDALTELGSLSATANSRLGTILRNTEQASTRIEPLLQSSNDAVRSLQLQVLPEAYRALTRLDHLSTTLDETAGLIRRNPSVLLRGSNGGSLGPGEGP